MEIRKDLCKNVPIIINEELLKAAIMAQADRDEKRILKEEGIFFNDVVYLSLGNKDIMAISHMWDFTSLKSLYLAHNVIRRIDGLQNLFNLKWLNLSYNEIEKIEGLESLHKLKVLQLSNNKISVIENMDTLEKLTEVDLGDNVIDQTQNVLYLRKLKNLNTLRLSGNPVTKEEDYIYFIAAYFPNLVHLDDGELDEDTRKAACIKFEDVKEEMESEDDQEDDFARFLNDCCPPGGMFKDDPEAGTLCGVPEIAQVMEKFERQIQELFTQIIAVSLTEHKQREAEMDSFNSVHAAALEDNKKKASKMLQQNLQRMMERLQESTSKNIIQPCYSLVEQEVYVCQTEVIVKLQKISDPDIQKEMIDFCKNECSKLSRILMEMEFLYVGQIEDIIKKLDRNLADMVSNFSETAEGIFTQCRDVEDECYDNVRKIAVATLEKVAKEEMDMELSDDVITLFTDRDAVMDALDTGHANHLRIISDMETQLLARVTAWKAAVIKGIEDKEVLRNRACLADCHNYKWSM